MIDDFDTNSKEYAAKKNQTIQVEQNIIDHYVYCDYLRICQIIFNMMITSVKLTPIGGDIKIWIKQTSHIEVDANTQYGTYEIHVKDNGIGMSKEHIKRIYSTREITEEKTYSDTDFGMCLTQKLVDLMDGTFEIKSKKGVGTEFIVTIRLCLAENSAKEFIGNKNIYSNQNSYADISKKSVLLVDDTDLEHSRDVFEKLGMVIDSTTNIQHAIEKLKNAKRGVYDFIVLDLSLAGNAEFDLAKQMRTLTEMQSNEIPIIAMSEDANQDLSAIKKAGMNAFITKPLNDNAVISAIEKLIKSDGGGRYSSRSHKALR